MRILGRSAMTFLSKILTNIVCYTKDREVLRGYLSSMDDGYGLHRRCFDYYFTLDICEKHKGRRVASPPCEISKVHTISGFNIQPWNASHSCLPDKDLWRILLLFQNTNHFHNVSACVLVVNFYLLKGSINAFQFWNMAIEMQFKSIRTAFYAGKMDGNFTRTALNAVRSTGLLHRTASDIVQI